MWQRNLDIELLLVIVVLQIIHCLKVLETIDCKETKDDIKQTILSRLSTLYKSGWLQNQNLVQTLR